MKEGQASKEEVTERLLENGALTDGLADEEAQLIMQWCTEKMAAFTPTDEQTLDEYGQRIARQARTVTRIANHVQDEDDLGRIKRRLTRLTEDGEKQAAFLKLLKDRLPLSEVINALLRLPEGH